MSNHESLVRNIQVGTISVPMRASALIPRLYRIKFGRDLMRDMSRLQKNMQAAKEDPDTELDAVDLKMWPGCWPSTPTPPPRTIPMNGWTTCPACYPSTKPYRRSCPFGRKT